MKTRYFSVYGGGNHLGVIKSDQTEKEFTDFIDLLHDKGLVLKSITKEQYYEYDEGDELTGQDLKEGNYEIIRDWKIRRVEPNIADTNLIDRFIKWLRKPI